MLAKLYKRRLKTVLISAVILFLGIPIVYIVNRPTSFEDWLLLFSIGFLFVLIVLLVPCMQKNYMLAKAIPLVPSPTSISKLNHFMLYKDIRLLPRLLLFEHDGTFIGSVKPVRFSFLCYPLALVLSDSLLVRVLPITFGLYDNEYQTHLTFTIKKTKTLSMKIIDANGDTLGWYVQDFPKKVAKIKGYLKDENGYTLLTVNIEDFTSHFQLFDDKGKQWVRYFKGYFYRNDTNILQQTHQDVITIAHDLEPKYKKLVIAMISYLFLASGK